MDLLGEFGALAGIAVGFNSPRSASGGGVEMEADEDDFAAGTIGKVNTVFEWDEHVRRAGHEHAVSGGLEERLDAFGDVEGGVFFGEAVFGHGSGVFSAVARVENDGGGGQRSEGGEGEGESGEDEQGGEAMGSQEFHSRGMRQSVWGRIWTRARLHFRDDEGVCLRIVISVFVWVWVSLEGRGAALEGVWEKQGLWEHTGETFAQVAEPMGFVWTSAARESARCSGSGLTLAGVPVVESVARFIGGRLVGMTASFYTRGDSQELSKEEFDGLRKRCVRGLRNSRGCGRT